MSGSHSPSLRSVTPSSRLLAAWRSTVARLTWPLLAMAAFTLIVGGLAAAALTSQTFPPTYAMSLATVVTGLGARANEPTTDESVPAAYGKPTDGSPTEVSTGGVVLPQDRTDGATSADPRGPGRVVASGTAVATGIPYAAIGVVLIAGAVSVMAVVARWREEGWT